MSDVDPPANLPDPLIYGPAFPELRLVMKHGRQRVESRTNRNVSAYSFLLDDEGIFPMSALPPIRACEHPETDGRCPMLFRQAEVHDDFGNSHLGWRLIEDELDITLCPWFRDLLALCQTETQRRFLQLWCSSQASPPEDDWDELAKDADSSNWSARRTRMTFPALIPEVWLNYLGPSKTADDELHLSENPSRVDFVLIAGGKKCVIEIDGPSHYADFDEENRRYNVSERRYTKNLRIERSLREQGWEIFRFSDFEVRTCVGVKEFRKLTRHLPGSGKYLGDDFPF